MLDQRKGQWKVCSLALAPAGYKHKPLTFSPPRVQQSHRPPGLRLLQRAVPCAAATNTICVRRGKDFTNKWVICHGFLLVSNADNGFMELKNRSALNFRCLILNIYPSYYDWIVLQNLNSFYIYCFISGHVSQRLCCSHLSEWHNHPSSSWSQNSQGQT